MPRYSSCADESRAPRAPLPSGLVDRACDADMPRCPERADKSPRMPAVFASPRTLAAVIFDVDGVILASAHEYAWREALRGITIPPAFTTAFYQTHVAGSRGSAAHAQRSSIWIHPDGVERAEAYGEHKQRILEELIAARDFTVFSRWALRFAHSLAAKGIPLAVASSSKNANQMMRSILLLPEQTLLDLFVNDRGRDLSHGKPDPEILSDRRNRTGGGAGWLPGRRRRARRHRGSACRRNDDAGDRARLADEALLQAACRRIWS